jgi:hypothetical protein
MDCVKYASIKKSYNSDNDSDELTEWNICIFNTKKEAINWICENYEYFGAESDSDSNDDEIKDFDRRALIENYFTRAPNGHGLFQWEWKRRGCDRTYRIVEFRKELQFYTEFNKDNIKTVRELYKSAK